MSELKGATTDYICYWHDDYGFVHTSDTEKLLEAYEQFRKKYGKQIITCSSPRGKNFFYDLYHSSSGSVKE